MDSIFCYCFLCFWLHSTECSCRQPLSRERLLFLLSLSPLTTSQAFSSRVLTIRRLCVIFISSFKKEQELGCQGWARKVSKTISPVNPDCFGLGVIQSLSLSPQIHYHFKPKWFWLVLAPLLTWWINVGTSGWGKPRGSQWKIFSTRWNPDKYILWGTVLYEHFRKGIIWVIIIKR